jgi:predicted acylesterase/phospholipase RssA/CRP-like cAMP-binding protein
MKDIIEELSSVALLAGMDKEHLLKIAGRVETKTLEPYEMLVEENSVGADLYFVRSGSFLVTVMDGNSSLEVARLGAGDVIGETQLISGGRRTATVRSLEKSEVLRLPHAEFDELLVVSEQLRNAVADIIHIRLRESALRRALPKAVGTDPELLELLSSRAQWVHIDRGEALWKQGQVADDWYVHLSGELTVTVTEHGVDRQIGSVRPGEVLGELALIREETRSSTIVATRKSWLARFDKRLLDEEILTRNGALKSLVMAFASRLSASSQSNKITPPIIAVFARDQTLDTESFVRELSEALGVGGIIVDLDVLRHEGVIGGAEQLPVDHPAWLRFEAWVESQREQKSYILLVTNGEDEPWTRIAVERSNTVLLLVDATADPARSEIELAVFGRFDSSPLPAIWLVPEHPADCEQPRDTAAWLNARTVQHHAHVRRGHKRDIARLARWLTGQIQGLALSGGGARGFTHLGVAAAMFEQGYEVDLISGTSAGSMSGALLARDAKLPIELMDRALEEFEAIGNPFVEFGIPLISVLGNRRLRSGMRNVFGDIAIEDSWIPFRVVVTNLSESRRVVFDRGPLWHRVLASSSPPGIWAPVDYNGQLLCDGGLVDNLPISVLLEENCKQRFASYVGSSVMLPTLHNGVPTSWEFLLDKIFRRKRHANMPSLLTTLLQCISIPAATQLQEARKSADVFFEPDLSAFSVTDVGGARAMFETGYAHAHSVLDQQKSKLHGTD